MKELIKVEIDVMVSDENIDDIMASAMDSSYGIMYWCDSATVSGDYLGKYASEQVSKGGLLILHDYIDDVNYVLTREKLIRGLKKWLKRTGFDLAVKPWEHSINILNTGMIDAPAADAIVQYSLFGDIVYG